jgi:hypothetical protein
VGVALQLVPCVLEALGLTSLLFVALGEGDGYCGDGVADWEQGLGVGVQLGLRTVYQPATVPVTGSTHCAAELPGRGAGR